MLKIVERDIKIFELFTKRRYIRRTFVHALMGYDSNAEFRKRLYDLEDWKYLTEPEGQKGSANYRYTPRVYELAPDGCDELGIPSVEDLAAKEFFHQLMVDDINASADLAAQSAGLEFKIRKEILGDKPFLLKLKDDRYVRPDDLFSIGGTHFAVEADCSGRESNKKRWRQKVELYGEAFADNAYQKQWGIKSLIVLCMFSKPTKAQNVRLMIENDMERSSRSLWFKGNNTLGRKDKTPDPHFFKLDDFWQRAGHQPSTILAALDKKAR